MTPDTAAAISILSADAVRQRAHRMLAIALEGGLEHFRVDLGRLGPAADLVVATTRTAYPDLAVPFHSRWRHFVAVGVDRWAAIERGTHWRDAAERARAAFDLAIVSVLLDAGAGARWTYRDRTTGNTVGRSEGLALATLTMFEDGVFSAQESDPLRVDAAVLCELSAEKLFRGFQVDDDNPLVGIDGRIGLLRRLGQVVAENPEVFGRQDSPRPGGLYDVLAGRGGEQLIRAPEILSELLIHLGPIWPSRHALAGIALGDCWRHPMLRTDDATEGLVPLHKLSQWLAYSLIEPLQWAGHPVTDIDGLTGLAEYRNGGLFVDTGVLVLRDPADSVLDHDVGSPLVVEWRALTVALLDELANKVRQRLDRNAAAFPLARLLQGGTWTAGRALAARLRSDGSSPFRVVSDGSVF